MGENLAKSDTPLVSNAVAAVRQLLSSWTFAHAGRLPSEAEIAGMIGVSRPVLRQALAVLKEEGVIESRRGSGTYVRGEPLSFFAYGKPETLADLQDCFRFRMIIESAAAAEAARLADRPAIEGIRTALATMDDSPSRDGAFADADMAFHRAVALATHNRYHVMTLEFLMPHIAFGLHLGRHLQMVSQNVTSRRVADEHQAIFEAIEAADEGLAAQKMRDHLAAGIERVFGKRSW